MVLHVTSTAGCASITITVYNDISKSKDDDPVQPMKSSFPKKDMFGKMRSFQTSWYKEFEYSKGNDAVYCFCCRHFPSLSGKHKDAIKSGFSNWHKAVEKLRKHSESVSHKNSMEMWANYMQARVSGTVVENMTKQSAIQMKENREYIKILARVAILCAKQEIALRGHREGPESLNKGNFLEILDLLRFGNDWFDKRVASAAKNIFQKLNKFHYVSVAALILRSMNVF